MKFFLRNVMFDQNKVKGKLSLTDIIFPVIKEERSLYLT